MGQNLVLNIEGKGYSVAVFNRNLQTVSDFIDNKGKGKQIIGCYSLEDLINHLERPRKIILMIKAGNSVDVIINKMMPLLDQGDIIIDGGNSHYKDTIRRTKSLEEKDFLFVGAGISGGEEGALKGPSIMPGGSEDAWYKIKDIFQKISAKVNDIIPCCEWIGNNGAGHFVKMVHNGIEYGNMQIICEAFHILKDLVGLNYVEMHKLFKSWNNNELESYLIKITSEILDYKDKNGKPLIKKILDNAGQKGTGKWTTISALDLSVPLDLISEAVFARYLSNKKEERVYASKVLFGPKLNKIKNKDTFINNLKDAVYMAIIISFIQGFDLLKRGSNKYNWNLNMGEISLLWREGCIIRSKFLDKIKEAYQNNPDISNLLLAPFFNMIVNNNQFGLRNVITQAVSAGIPVPAMSSALSYYDGYRTEKLPANLLQAQRDYFGAHKYQRIDKSKDEFFHTDWTDKGGHSISTN